MADNSQPHIIRPPEPPFIECQCGSKVTITSDDMKLGKIPAHTKWYAPEEKCPWSRTPLKGIPVHNLRVDKYGNYW